MTCNLRSDDGGRLTRLSLIKIHQKGRRIKGRLVQVRVGDGRKVANQAGRLRQARQETGGASLSELRCDTSLEGACQDCSLLCSANTFLYGTYRLKRKAGIT